MLNSLFKLGKLWIEKEDLDTIDVLLDEVQLRKRTKRVLIVELNWEEDDKFSFRDVITVEYDSKNNKKYLYKKGLANNKPYIMPSSLIPGKEKAKSKSTFNSKIMLWFKEFSDENNVFYNIFLCLDENKNEISNLIAEKFSEIEPSNRENVLITLKFNKNNNSLFLGDIELFKEYFVKNSVNRYVSKEKNKGNGTCFLCGDEKEVFGAVSNSIGFGFSTSQKEGNIQGINSNNQWKQIPICGDCVLSLEAGKKFVETFLSFSEYGLNYYVIPEFLFDDGTSLDFFYDLVTNLGLSKSDDLVVMERDFKDIATELDDFLEFKFLFYVKDNNAFDILFFVESALPSWLSKILNYQKEIINYPIFSEDSLKEIISDKSSGNLIDILIDKGDNYLSSYNWYLSFLKDFLSNFYNSKNKQYNKFYFDIVHSVMSGSPIDKNFIFFLIMEEIRRKWKNRVNEGNGIFQFRVNILKSLALFTLFSKLGLFVGDNMALFDIDNLSGEDILKNLDSYDKKASFYLGILTRYLVNVQFAVTESSPFVNKLWDFSLDQKRIKQLYPKVIDKLRQYGRTYTDLETHVSYNLACSDNNWNLNRDETSYYFALGYTLAKLFKQESDEEKLEKIDEENSEE